MPTITKTDVEAWSLHGKRALTSSPPSAVKVAHPISYYALGNVPAFSVWSYTLFRMHIDVCRSLPCYLCCSTPSNPPDEGPGLSIYYEAAVWHLLQIFFLDDGATEGFFTEVGTQGAAWGKVLMERAVSGCFRSMGPTGLTGSGKGQLWMACSLRYGTRGCMGQYKVRGW